MPETTELTIGALIDTLADAIADRIADRLADRLEDRQPSDLLTVAEAADYIRAKPQRIYDLAHQGRLAVEKDGSRVLIRRLAIDRYLNLNERTDK